VLFAERDWLEAVELAFCSGIRSFDDKGAELRRVDASDAWKD